MTAASRISEWPMTMSPTPSLVQLDQTEAQAEADVITAARAVADLPLPAVDLSSTEAMTERDALRDAMDRLRDAIQRLDGTEPWRPGAVA